MLVETFSGIIKRRSRPVTAVTSAFLVVGLVLAAAPAQAAEAHFNQTPLASWRTSGTGYATLVVGNTVYVGGTFARVLSQDGTSRLPRTNLAAFDATTGNVISTFQANTDAGVHSLATDGTRLFVGGDFTTVNGTPRSKLAAVDLATGAVDPWTADANNTVLAMKVSNGQLFVGGRFTTLAGATRTRLGAVNLLDGSPTSFAPSANNVIQSLAVDSASGIVYAGGRQTTINGSPSAYLSKLNPLGSLLPMTWSSLTTSAQALDLSADGTRLAVMSVANTGAWYDTSSGARRWSQRCDGNGQAVKIIGDSVVLGFHDGCSGVTGVDATINRISDGARDPSFNPVFNLFWGVRAMDGNASVLVTAGSMTSVSGVPVGGFAIFPSA